MSKPIISLKRKVSSLQDINQSNLSAPPTTAHANPSSPTASICQNCKSIDFNQLPPNPSSEWRHSALPIGTLSEIISSQFCRLCQLFSSMASLTQSSSQSQSLSVQFYLVAFYTSAMYGHDWRSSRKPKDILDTVSFAVLDENSLNDKKTSFDKESKLANDLWISRTAIMKSGWLTPANASSKTVSHRLTANILGSKIDFDIVKGWLDFCLINHVGKCALVNQRPLIGLRVIDCETGKIVLASEDCEYLALSYVWGSSTTYDDKELDSLNILDGTAPNLVKDAMQVTKHLGYRYLWVDRYCIKQHAEDRHSQINQMDLVYNKARATIIAAASPDPTIGLTGVGSKLRSPSVTLEIGSELYTYVPPDPSREILQSQWNQRGWTHQETILSRRRIFFCSNQVYFECTGMHCCDSMDLPLERLHTSNLRAFKRWNRPRLFETIRCKQYPLDDIRDHLAEYTRRSFTRSDDILNGIMGTFHALTNEYPAMRHYWGIPAVPDVALEPLRRKVRWSSREEQFLTGLCWSFASVSSSISNSQDIGSSFSSTLSGSTNTMIGVKRRPNFPSWSWAGWHGRLKPHSETEGYISNTYGVKIWLESIFPSSLDLQTFCDGPMEYFPRYSNPCILIEAEVVRIGFRYSSSISGQRWEAIFDIEDGACIYAPFFITPEWCEGDELCESLLASDREWSGFLLGERLTTFYSGAGRAERRVLRNTSPHIVIMVVEEHEDDTVERIGMIEFDQDQDPDQDAFSRVATQRKTLRLG